LDQLAEEALRDYREGEVHPAPVKLGSALSPKFFDTYRHLSPGIRAKVRESYRLFVADPASVKFKTIKRLADGNQLCSARVTRDCRVLGVVANREGKMPWSCQAAGYQGVYVSRKERNNHKPRVGFLGACSTLAIMRRFFALGCHTQ
jgi:hypothetical protein